MKCVMLFDVITGRGNARRGCLRMEWVLPVVPVADPVGDMAIRFRVKEMP